MKDSGIDWLGDIPADWSVCRIKNLANIFTGNSIKDEQKEFYEDPIASIPYIATKDIDATLQTINFSNGMYIKLSDESFKRAPAQSTLLCIEGGSAGKKIAYTNREVCFVNKLCCLHSNTCSNKYLYYYLMSPAFTQLFNSHISGLIGGVSVVALKNFKIILPPLEEQQRIAAFLDGECARIDYVVEKTRASIEEYKKLKQAIISQAVTKGIRPNRPMKVSGVEWLGDIPADWNVIKLKYIFSIIGGNGFPEILQGKNDGDYPFCKVSDINGEGDYVDTASNWVSQLVVDSNHFNVIPTGSIIMAKIGAALAKNHRKINSVRCCIDNNTQALVRKRNDDIRYLLYLSRCIDMSWFDNNSTVPSISNPKLLNFPVINVPKSEQEEIAAYLDEKTAAIDSLVAKKGQLLTELEGYKKSLIFEYVTGKKEVPT